MNTQCCPFMTTVVFQKENYSLSFSITMPITKCKKQNHFCIYIISKIYTSRALLILLSTKLNISPILVPACQVIHFQGIKYKYPYIIRTDPFDYYILNFALHLINNSQNKSTWENWNSVYFALACDYLMHFLPADPNITVLPPIPNYTGKVPMAAPLQTANR